MPNFKSKNEGVDFPYNPDAPDQGHVTLREIDPNEHLRIEKIVSKTKRKVVGGQVAEIVTRDTKMAARLTWDYCIVGWGKTQLDGKDLECTTDNKVKMMGVIDFAKFVADSLETMVSVNQTIAEQEVKNSESTSSGN